MLRRTLLLASVMTVVPFAATSTVAQEGLAKVEVGQPAPDFELQDSKGTSYRLSDFAGKQAVILEFFRSGSW